MKSVLGDRSGKYIDIVAHHYAEAVAYRMELDSLIGVGADRLVERAVARLIEAAERAERLHVYDQAARLFDRAATTLGAVAERGVADSASIIDLRRRAADAHGLAGDVGAAFEEIRGLLAAVGKSDPVLRGSLLERFRGIRVGGRR